MVLMLASMTGVTARGETLVRELEANLSKQRRSSVSGPRFTSRSGTSR